MKYIEKAPKEIKEFAKNNKEFAELYEKEKELREWVDDYIRADKEVRRKVVELVLKAK